GGDPGAELAHGAGELVSADVTGAGDAHRAAVGAHVRSADADQCHLDDYLTRPRDRFGYLADAHRIGSVPAQRPHESARPVVAAAAVPIPSCMRLRKKINGWASARCSACATSPISSMWVAYRSA